MKTSHALLALGALGGLVLLARSSSASSSGGIALLTPVSDDPLKTSDAVSRDIEGDLRQIPARALSMEQANELVDRYLAQGIVVPCPGTGKTAGVCASNYLGRPKVNFLPTIAGVLVGPEVRIGPLDARFAIFIIRLTLFLKERYGVTRVDHLSITRDDKDCGGVVGRPSAHQDGRAMDFSGARGPSFGAYDVLTDWGKKPATYPAGSRQTSYRLSPGDHGYQFYIDVWAFMSNEGSDSNPEYVVSENRSDFLHGGLPSFIIQPDYADPTLRAQHQNHMHVQIGRTCDVG